MPAANAVAVPVALCAAAAFGGAAVLQHRAARRVPDSGLVSVQLLRAQLRQDGFVASLGLAILGFVLQAAALRYAPLTLVQPLLITDTLFFIGFACLIHRRPPDRRLVLAALLAMGGIAAFILIARPTAGSSGTHAPAALSLGLALVVVVGACLAVATRLSGYARVLPLAIATAVCYGVTAGLLRSVAAGFDGDVLGLAGEWQVYALAVLGAAGFWLNQHAYQKGHLGTVAVATITVGDPATSIVIGIVWLGESIQGGPWATFGEVVSLLVVAAGILLLAARSQQITEQIQSAAEPLQELG